MSRSASGGGFVPELISSDWRWTKACEKIEPWCVSHCQWVSTSFVHRNVGVAPRRVVFMLLLRGRALWQFFDFSIRSLFWPRTSVCSVQSAAAHNGVAADSALSAFKGYLKVNTQPFQNPRRASFLPPVYAVCRLNGRREGQTGGAVFRRWTINELIFVRECTFSNTTQPAVLGFYFDRGSAVCLFVCVFVFFLAAAFCLCSPVKEAV